MRAKPISPDEQLRLVMECRSSGLSDYQWCQMNGIKSGTFYNWVSRLRKRGAAVPHCPNKTEKLAVVKQQSVVKLDLLPEPETFSLLAEQNACKEVNQVDVEKTAMEICIGNASIRFFDRATSCMLETTLKCLGGAFYAG